jgi:small-conductance mechanosensitive channel
VGDFIRLESGQEGYVEDITWRTTRVRMLTKSVVVIPNRKLAQSVVTNYYLPDTRVSVSIPIRVGYSADADLVERIIREESEAALPDLPGVVDGQGPSISFNFGESSLDFSLDLDVKEFVDQYRVRNELRKRIFRRFRAEGIEMAVPTRTIYMRDAKEGSGPSGATE